MIERDLKEYAIEIALMVLKKASVKLDELKEIGDLSGTEILEEKVIVPYEKIYGAFLELDEKKMSEDELENIKKILEEIKEKNNLREEEIEISIEKRRENVENSGAKVVEKFYRYNINKLVDIKEKIVEKYEKLADTEEKLENELKDTVQEEEQFDIIYKLQPVREEIREVEAKYLKVEKDIDELQKKLKSKWPYEIYGIISEEELLKTYKETFKMEE